MFNVHIVNALKWQLIWHAVLMSKFSWQSSHDIHSTTNSEQVKELCVASQLFGTHLHVLISPYIDL